MLKYHIENEEKDKAVIWITGAGISHWMWENQMILPYKHILFDLPGHGENADVSFVSISSTVNDIKEIMKVEDIDKAVFIGHSIGAQTVMHILEHESQMVDKAVVISGLNKPMAWMNFMIGPMISMSMPLVKNKSFSKLQGAQLSLPDDMFERYYEDSLKLSKLTLKNIMRENLSFKFSGTTLDGNSICFIYGSKEKGIMKSSAQKNHQLVNESQLVKLIAAHGIPYEVPEELNRIIEDVIG